MKRTKRTFKTRYYTPTPQQQDGELQALAQRTGTVLPWCYQEPEDKKYKASLSGMTGPTWFYGETPEELMSNFQTFLNFAREENEARLREMGYTYGDRAVILDLAEHEMRLTIATQIADGLNTEGQAHGR